MMYAAKLSRAEIAFRRKAARRAERAARAAAIEAEWLKWMYRDHAPPTQVPHARHALTFAELPRVTARPAPPVFPADADWPAGIPRPSDGHPFPSVKVLARWLGERVRRFRDDEVNTMYAAWCDALQNVTEHAP
ncbi:hypothetical protein [Actinomadura rifamycini]|uniref:hypothetical protein n=1 Tax=Actinomadura rifamycini TaxID=31962 RepID=UPI0012FBCD88|nr:hypothetical protein [Actinomadura rifamycini]